MTRIASVHGVLADHTYTQQEITDYVADKVLLGDLAKLRPQLEKFHAATTVKTRSFALPMEGYEEIDGFGAANDTYIEVSLDLAEKAALIALEEAGFAAPDVDFLLVASTTGIAAPGLDARLIPRLGIRQDVKRLAVFGLGCVAGVAGVARVHDYLAGHPDEVGLLITVELPSITFQRADFSIANIVASGLFGDGAAAVVMVGDTRAQTLPAAQAGPRVVDTVSRLYPDTERVMGWDVGDDGFGIVLDARVPEVVDTYLREDVDGFLGAHDLTVPDVGTWVAHPGGPKVLEAMQRSLELGPEAFEVTWTCLAEVGNLSSSSVLHVLERTLRKGLPRRGTPGLLTALGPGFCSELVLVEW